ncbi:MAG: hypothetical protein WC254_02930 [Candidatus Woesearchaeota archaeon]|jgi:hypothetical protein
MEQASIYEGYEEFGKHEDEKPKKSIFSDTKPAASSLSYTPDGGEQMSDQMRSMSRRLRVLEERYANQRKSLQVLEHNMLSENKKIQALMHTFQTDLNDMKKQLYEMKQKFDIIGGELAGAAKREDVIILEKYINFWEPVNFVTRNEVEKLVNACIEKSKKK